MTMVLSWVHYCNAVCQTTCRAGQTKGNCAMHTVDVTHIGDPLKTMARCFSHCLNRARR